MKINGLDTKKILEKLGFEHDNSYAGAYYMFRKSYPSKSFQIRKPLSDELSKGAMQKFFEIVFLSVTSDAKKKTFHDYIDSFDFSDELKKALHRRIDSENENE